MVPPTVKTALPTSVNIPKIILHLPEDSRVYQVDNQYYIGSFCLTGWLTGWLVCDKTQVGLELVPASASLVPGIAV